MTWPLKCKSYHFKLGIEVMYPQQRLTALHTFFADFMYFVRAKFVKMSIISHKKVKNKMAKKSCNVLMYACATLLKEGFFLVVFVGLERLWQNDRTTTTFQCGTKKSS